MPLTSRLEIFHCGPSSMLTVTARFESAFPWYLSWTFGGYLRRDERHHETFTR